MVMVRYMIKPEEALVVFVVITTFILGIWHGVIG